MDTNTMNLIMAIIFNVVTVAITVGTLHVRNREDITKLQTRVDYLEKDIEAHNVIKFGKRDRKEGTYNVDSVFKCKLRKEIENAWISA